MELTVSSPKPGALSPPDCVSDPEEKEVSEEEDDDRNHKHRRRETRSQSLERDSVDQVFSRPYRKRNKPFENGHPFGENDPQASETWKSYNGPPPEKDLTTKFERRRFGAGSIFRPSFDMNQRMRGNQAFVADNGPSRGRGRDSGLWTQRDSRFNTVDVASQIVQPGSVVPNLFAGRGLPNVSNTQNASWSAFGLIPGMPNGGVDALHSIGLQGTLRPPMNPSLNMGLPRKRCRDFEERGFCLRGDMCPMEHGINRIVVEDVQSLSQFNLPVSLPSAQLIATPAGPGPLSAVVPPAMNGKGAHSKGGKPGFVDDCLGLNGSYPVSGGASGADLYDPDQPLWNNNGPEASAPYSPKINETETLISDDLADRNHVTFRDSSDNEFSVRSSGSQSTSLSVWGRISGSRNRQDTKEKIDSLSSDYIENETKEGQEGLPIAPGNSRQGKKINADHDGSKAMDSALRSQSDSMRNVRKPSQKALRTLFVNGIPQKNNRREALLLHFRKFGEVIDIYIPSNSERAFVQFSKREEAEAALKSPDAVMGNRFIKLWWANRDSIPDDGVSVGSSINPRGPAPAAIPAQPSVANRGKDIVQPFAQKSNISMGPDIPSSDSPKPISTNGPKLLPPSQKKLETLEQLKEELRKKQEMLDQKRNDFRRQLDKLEKQAAGGKSELPTDQASKRQKLGMSGDPVKATTPRSTDPVAAAASPSIEAMADKDKSAEHIVSNSSKSNAAMTLQESVGSKQQIHPLAPTMAPFVVNKYKLDNRPVAFRVLPPLPAGFADAGVLKEHFLQYGDLSAVELEEIENQDADGSLETKKCSARVTFLTRRSAERAFVNGKCWQGHNLQFVWLMSSDPTSDSGSKDNSLLTTKGRSDSDVQTDDILVRSSSLEAIPSVSRESDDSERKSSVGQIELLEDLQSSPTTISSEKESPKSGMS